MNVKKTLYGTAAALCTLGAINAVNIDELKERQGIASEPADTAKAMIYLCGALGAGMMAMGKRGNGEHNQSAELSQGDLKNAVVNATNNLQNNCADFMKEAKNMALKGKEIEQPKNKKEIPFTVNCGDKQIFANAAAEKLRRTY